MHIFYLSIIVLLLALILHLNDEVKNNRIFDSKGLKDNALSYYLHLNSELSGLDESKKYLLSKAKEALLESQKGYGFGSNVPYWAAMYSDEFKNTFRKEVFSYCMILRYRHYPDNEFARKAAYVYYKEYEKALADLYDCSFLQGLEFPMSIISYYYPQGYEIIEKQSQYFNKNENE